MDWQLSLFRLGLLACALGALLLATQFDLVDSIVAVWNHNPTSGEFDASTTAAVTKRASCLSNETQTKVQEYPSHCDVATPVLRGLARDQAVANLRGFAIALLGLLFAIFLVASLGSRMARESRT